MSAINIKTALTNLTPNQCTEVSETMYSCIKIGTVFYVQVVTVVDGKVTSVSQPTSYATAALAKTAVNALMATYIDSLV